jgi:hypothetical protein
VPSFAELSDKAKEAARQHNAQTLDDWWDCVYEDAVECAKCLGIEIGTVTRSGRLREYQEVQIYFSGFSSQGDGAMFLGRYRPCADACAAIAAHAPQDEKLKYIAAELTALQVAAGLQYGRQIEATITELRRSGNYCHSGCMSVDATFVDKDDDESPTSRDEETLRDLLRAFADWIYKQLEAEYDYLCSDEALQEREFDEEGALV